MRLGDAIVEPRLCGLGAMRLALTRLGNAFSLIIDGTLDDFLYIDIAPTLAVFPLLKDDLRF